MDKCRRRKPHPSMNSQRSLCNYGVVMISSSQSRELDGLTIHTEYDRNGYFGQTIVARWYEWHKRTVRLTHSALRDGCFGFSKHSGDLKVGDRLKIGGVTARVIEVEFYTRSVYVHRGRLWIWPIVTRRVWLALRKFRARIIFTLDVWGLAHVPEMADCSWLHVYAISKIHTLLKKLRAKLF